MASPTNSQLSTYDRLSGTHTVSRWAQEGMLPYLRTLGGHRRYPDAEIQASEPVNASETLGRLVY